MSLPAVHRVMVVDTLPPRVVRMICFQVVSGAGYTRTCSLRSATTFGRPYRPRWLTTVSWVAAPPTLGLSLLALFVRGRHVCTVTVETRPRGSRVHLAGELDAEIVRTLEEQLAQHPVRPSPRVDGTLGPSDEVRPAAPDGPGEPVSGESGPPSAREAGTSLVPPAPPLRTGRGTPAIPALPPPAGASSGRPALQRPTLERPSAPTPSRRRDSATPTWEEALGLAPARTPQTEVETPAAGIPRIPDVEAAPPPVDVETPEVVEAPESVDAPEVDQDGTNMLDLEAIRREAMSGLEAIKTSFMSNNDEEPAAGEDETGTEDAPPEAPDDTVEAHVLVFDDGRKVVVSGAGVMGRNPKDNGKKTQTIRVPDPERSLSATHLAFAVDEEGLWIVDRRSTNGTFLLSADGERTRCSAGERVLVPAGTRVAIGARWFDATRARHEEQARTA